MHVLNNCYNKKITTAINAINYTLQNEDFQHCAKQLKLEGSKINVEDFMLVYNNVEFPFSVKAVKPKFFTRKKASWFQPGRQNVLLYNVKETGNYSEVKNFKLILSKSLEMFSKLFKEDLNFKKNEFDKKFTLIALAFAKEQGLISTPIYQ